MGHTRPFHKRPFNPPTVLHPFISWVDGRPEMMPSISSPATIALTKGHTPVYTVIERKETWEAMRTLGVRVAPDGNYRKEAQFLKTKADTFAARLMTSNLNRMDTFIFHRSTYTPSMTYPICLTTLTRTQLNKIQSKAISAILDKLGINRHFPRRVAFGPKELCGLSLLDLSVEQGIRQISTFHGPYFCDGLRGRTHNDCSSISPD